MKTLKIYAKIDTHTNVPTLNSWLRGLPGLKEASFVREIDLQLDEHADLPEIRRTLSTCPYAEIVDHELLDDTVAITEDGIAAIAGEIAPEHEALVVGHNADEKLLRYAELLNGREYRDEIVDAESLELKEEGIILIFGASDDLMEVRGASYDEYDNGEDVTYFYWNGNEFVKDGTEGFVAEDGASRVVALWCPEGKKHLSWGFETDVERYATFEIMEDDECYGEGLLIYKDDLVPKALSEAEILLNAGRDAAEKEFLESDLVEYFTEEHGMKTFLVLENPDKDGDDWAYVLHDEDQEIITGGTLEVLKQFKTDEQTPDENTDTPKSEEGGANEAGSDKVEDSTEEIESKDASTESQEQKQDADVSPTATKKTASKKTAKKKAKK